MDAFPVKGLGIEVAEQVPLAPFTTWRIGGKARWLVQPQSGEQLGQVMLATRHLPRLLLGGGGNLLLADEGFDGVVVRLGKGLEEISLVSPTLVEAGGAATTRALAHFARRHELAGVEFLAGIPGRVGGAVIMNAGAYGGDIGQVLVAARVMDLQGQLHWSTASDLGLGYRKSRIPAGWVVVGARFQLHPTSGEMIRQRMREMNRKRSSSQPLAWPSAGSTFKNPDGGDKAWALIEKAGMRGVRIGGAQVAEKHCNFLINLDNASGEDMRQLIRLVTQRVWETSGILLELEVKVVESDGRAWSP